MKEKQEGGESSESPDWSSICMSVYDTVSDHLESLSTSVPEILTAGRLNGQCCGLYG